MKDLSESTIRHLEIIEDVIRRMASSSFALKAISGTLTAAVIAYAGSLDRVSPIVFFAGIVPCVVFWFMDAQYLRNERLFRKLYDAVCAGEISEPFDMNFRNYRKQVAPLPVIALSWSILWFYMSLVAALIAIGYVST